MIKDRIWFRFKNMYQRKEKLCKQSKVVLTAWCCQTATHVKTTYKIPILIRMISKLPNIFKNNPLQL